MTTSSRLRAWLAHIILPRTCAHCRRDLPARQEEPLCPDCRKALLPVEPPFCLRCGQPLSRAQALCPACDRRPWACRTIRAAFLYAGPMPGLVHGFKYRGRRTAALAAGAWMGAHMARFPELSGYHALVPVPLHPARLRERGYNQAELLAEALAPACGLPVRQFLRRGRHTRPQWDLDKEARRRNLKDAFLTAGQVRGQRLILVDDVCTSGASLEECARVLHRAGARQVAGYVLARQTL